MLLLKIRAIGKKLSLNSPGIPLGPGEITKIVGSEIDKLFVLETQTINTSDEKCGNQHMKLICYGYDDKSVKQGGAMDFKGSIDDISKCNRLVVAINRKNKAIYLGMWGEKTPFMRSGVYLKNPYAVLAVDDNAVLITNLLLEGSLHRWEELGGEWKEGWECNGLKEPSIICEDQHHNIFVASASADAVIYTISPRGKSFNFEAFRSLLSSSAVMTRRLYCYSTPGKLTANQS